MIPKTACLLILCLPAFAQKVTTNSVKQKLESIRVVKLDLPGRLSISNTKEQQLDFNYSVLSSGKIHGWSNKGQSLIYNPIFRTSHDTLYISAKKEIWVIGFSYYKEEISQILFLPEEIELVVQAHDELTISGAYKKVSAINTHLTVVNLMKVEVGKIICHSEKGQIKLNGESKANSFEFAGPSNNEYIIDSKNIFINLK